MGYWNKQQKRTCAHVYILIFNQIINYISNKNMQLAQYLSEYSFNMKVKNRIKMYTLKLNPISILYIIYMLIVVKSTKHYGSSFHSMYYVSLL